MKPRMDSIIPMHDDDEELSFGVINRRPTEEEIVFQQFCDCVDAHLKWKGQPPIASNDEERREKAMMYMLRSIEAYRWFTELVGGLDILEKLLAGSNKRREVSEASSSSERMVRKKPRFVVKVDRADDSE